MLDPSEDIESAHRLPSGSRSWSLKLGRVSRRELPAHDSTRSPVGHRFPPPAPCFPPIAMLRKSTLKAGRGRPSGKRRPPGAGCFGRSSAPRPPSPHLWARSHASRPPSDCLSFLMASPTASWTLSYLHPLHRLRLDLLHRGWSFQHPATLVPPLVRGQVGLDSPPSGRSSGLWPGWRPARSEFAICGVAGRLKERDLDRSAGRRGEFSLSKDCCFPVAGILSRSMVWRWRWPRP